MKFLISTISSFVSPGISQVVRSLIRKTLVAISWLWCSTKLRSNRLKSHSHLLLLILVLLTWSLSCQHRYSIVLLGLLPDTQNCGLRMRRECRERFPHHQLQRKPLVSDPGIHHGTCVTHVPWCMSGSLTRGGGENVPGIPVIFTYLARGS